MDHEGPMQRSGLTRKGFLVGAAGLGGAVMLAGLPGCGSGSGTAGSAGGRPKPGGVLQFAVSDASQGEVLDVLQSVDQHQGIYASLLWEQLIDFDENFRWKPKLAVGVNSNHDASVWTFKLRPGIKWHDGKPFKSKDVKWTVARILDIKNASPWYSQAAGVLDVDGIETPDPLTVVFRLKQPDTLFPLLFRGSGTGIVQDGWEPNGKPADAVGTGPFVAERWKAGSGFEFVRNPKYWGGAPYLDGVRSVIIADPASKLESVVSGPSHVSDSISPTQVKTLEGHPVEVVRFKGFYSTYLTMDTRKKPFDDNDVRTAFKLAADPQQTLDVAYAGYGMLGDNCSAPANSPWFPTQLEGGERDVAQAKALLAKAGYPNGVDVELIAAPVVGAIQEMAVVYAGAAKDAGIRVSIKQWEVDTFFDQVWLKQPFYVDYLVRTHPLQALQETFVKGAPWNETFLAGSRAEEFVLRGLRETDEQRRDQIAREAMLWQAQNEGIILSAFQDRLLAKKDILQGDVASPSGFVDYSKAWLAT